MTQFTIFLILIIFVAFLLVVVIMVQNPKGGGLGSAFGGGGTQLGGVKKTTDFLDKSTWTLAIVLLALILFSNISLFEGTSTDTLFEDNLQDTTLPAVDNTNTDTTTNGDGQ